MKNKKSNLICIISSFYGRSHSSRHCSTTKLQIVCLQEFLSNIAWIEMLKFIVFWHVISQSFRKQLDIAGSLQFTDQSSSVFLKFFFFDFFICVKIINLFFQIFNSFKSFNSFSFFVISKILKKFFGCQIFQFIFKDITLIFEELINCLLTMNIVENISCESNNNVQRFIKEMRFKSELQLSNIFSCNSFFIKFE